MFTVVIIGEFFFIGLFHEDDEVKVDFSVKNVIISFSWRDFCVMIYSILFMLIITMFLGMLFSRKVCKRTASDKVILKAWRINRIKSIVGLALSWILLVYFMWSIFVFAATMAEASSYMWVISSIFSFFIEILIIETVKILAIAYIVYSLKYFNYKVQERFFKPEPIVHPAILKFSNKPRYFS